MSFEGSNVYPAQGRPYTNRNPIAGRCCSQVSILGCGKGELVLMTENERRAQDILTREDLLVRGLATVGLVAMFLFILLTVTT